MHNARSDAVRQEFLRGDLAELIDHHEIKLLVCCLCLLIVLVNLNCSLDGSVARAPLLPHPAPAERLLSLTRSSAGGHIQCQWPQAAPGPGPEAVASGCPRVRCGGGRLPGDRASERQQCHERWAASCLSPISMTHAGRATAASTAESPIYRAEQALDAAQGQVYTSEYL
jgi:hypothetical protein